MDSVLKLVPRTRYLLVVGDTSKKIPILRYFGIEYLLEISIPGNHMMLSIKFTAKLAITVQNLLLGSFAAWA